MSVLSGKVIISTRPEIENDRIKNLLLEKGASVIDFPLIRTEQIAINSQLADDLNQLDSFQWIIFTSRNGVICFESLLKQAGKTVTSISDKKIGVIGKATGDEVHKYLGKPALISKGRNAEEMLIELENQVSPSDNVLLALAELADDKLENGLKKWCNVKRINVYRTIDIEYHQHPVVEIICKNEYDLILFTSPSGYRNFYRITEKLEMNQLKAACIGTTTEAEMRKLGASPVLVSPRSDADSFANEIEKYLLSTN